MMPEDLLCAACCQQVALSPPGVALPPGAGLQLWIAGPGSDRVLAAEAQRLAQAGQGVFFHHAGLGGDCDSPTLLLRRLLGQLREHAALSDAVPDARAALRETLPNWLARAAARGAFHVLIADAQRLQGPGLDVDLDWLPAHLPPGVRVVVATAPGLLAESLRQRPGTQTLELPLPPAAGAPSWPPDQAEIYRLLWTARAGLDRDELRRLGLAHIPGELPGVHEHQGRLLLLDPVLREQVATRLLPDHGARQALHLRLAAGYQQQPGAVARRLAAWHGFCAGHSAALHALLSRPESLADAEDADTRYEWLRAWDSLLPASDLPVALAAALDSAAAQADPDAAARARLGAARLLTAAGVQVPLDWLQQAADGALDPALKARALERLGAACSEADPPQPEPAERALRAALELRLAQHGEAAAETGSVRHRLAYLYELRGELGAAVTLYREGLAAREARLGTEDPQLIPWLANLAGALQAVHRLADAEQAYRRALKIARLHLGLQHPVTAVCCDQLAGIRYACADYAQAEALYREGLAITEAALGPAHSATAACLHNLGTALDAAQQFTEAEHCHRRALAIRRETFGQQHADTATSLHNLAACLEATQRLDEAERHYGEALEIWNALHGEEHPAFATTLNNLAGVRHARGDWAAAEKLYRADIGIWQRLLGERHPNTLGALAGLARLYCDGGKHELAEPLLEHVLEVSGEVMGRGDALYLDTLCLLAALLRDSGRAEPARARLQAALAACEQSLGLLSPRVQQLRRMLDTLDPRPRAEPLHG